MAKHRRDFELEVANKEYDNAIQTAMYDAEENLRNTTDRIRMRIQEAICTVQVDHALSRAALRTNAVPPGGVGGSSSECVFMATEEIDKFNPWDLFHLRRISRRALASAERGAEPHPVAPITRKSSFILT